MNHLFYGERDNPYRALARVAEQLSDPRHGLTVAADDIRAALRVPFVEIESTTGYAVSSGARHPTASVVEFPCGTADSVSGRMLVQPRGAGDRFSTGERQLLTDLARQVGVALHEAALTADLQESRERIVIAREEERRAVRRTLHDDIGPSLAALGLVAETARRLRAHDPADPGVDELLASLSSGTRGAAESVRALAYDLRPPELDDRGLVGALRDHAAAMSPIDVTIDAAMDALAGPLSAAVEAAAYRIAIGALTNVSKHADATRAVVRLVPEADSLTVTVEDDGVGMPPGGRPGVGLTAMRERAAELGGH